MRATTNNIVGQIKELPCHKLSLINHPIIDTKVKVDVSPIYDPYVGECLLERTLSLGHRLFEVGWPVPFLATLISSVFSQDPHSLLGGQWASVQL